MDSEYNYDSFFKIDALDNRPPNSIKKAVLKDKPEEKVILRILPREADSQTDSILESLRFLKSLGSEILRAPIGHFLTETEIVLVYEYCNR